MSSSSDAGASRRSIRPDPVHRRPNRSTGTLADLVFLRTLGATVIEVDLDAEDGDSDEEDERDGNALVDNEAEEEEEEE